MKLAIRAMAMAAVLAGASVAQAAIVSVSAASFEASAGLVSYASKQLGTISAQTIAAGTLSSAEAGATGVTAINYGGLFAGQAIEATCGQLVACKLTDSTPTANSPLALKTGTTARIAVDASRTAQGSHALSGNPTFYGPIAILFDTNVMAAGFDAGAFNAIGSSVMMAFDEFGVLLGTLGNTSKATVDANGELILGSGWEFLGLGDDTGAHRIRGLLLAAVGTEALGFVLDNLHFGDLKNVTPPVNVPEPSPIALLVVALAGATFVRGRRS